MPIESEIKFTVPEKTLFDIITSLPDIAGYLTVDRGTAQHTDTYFDTTDFRLFSDKIVFRLRISGSGTVLAFKAQAPSDNDIHRRIEIESSTDISIHDITRGNLPDLPPVKALYDRTGIVNLTQSLNVVNDRHTILLYWEGEAHYELVLDDVTFCGQKGTTGVLELEVESLIGVDNDLRRIDQWFKDRYNLKPAGPSKYILGMELVGGIM